MFLASVLPISPVFSRSPSISSTRARHVVDPEGRAEAPPCHHCRPSLIFEVKMQRADLCPHCAADLQCCKNCARHWDRERPSNQCREHITEQISDRDEGEPLHVVHLPERRARGSAARVAASKCWKLDALFGGEATKLLHIARENRLRRPPAKTERETERGARGEPEREHRSRPRLEGRMLAAYDRLPGTGEAPFRDGQALCRRCGGGESGFPRRARVRVPRRDGRASRRTWSRSRARSSPAGGFEIAVHRVEGMQLGAAALRSRPGAHRPSSSSLRGSRDEPRAGR